MIGIKVKVEDNTKAVQKAADKAGFRNLAHAAASLRKDARASIQRAPAQQRTRAKSRGGHKVRRARHAASRPGTPPHTQRGQLPNAIVFDVAPKSVVIGPRRSVVGESAGAHEFGGEFKGADYPDRPFMGPALERAAPRFAGSFAGSIGD